MQALLIDIQNSDRGFLIMDCEGAEEQLLTESMHVFLKQWHILLEVHDFHAPGAGDRIHEMFESSHDIIVIWSREPSPSDLSQIAPWPLNHLCLSAFRSMFAEGRGCSMRFFYLSPKSA